MRMETIILILILAGGLLAGVTLITQSDMNITNAKVNALAEKQQGTLADYSQILGEPKTLRRVACAGAQCTRAVWDISPRGKPCWKRFIVVLNDQNQQVFMTLTEELRLVEYGLNGPVCVVQP